MERSNKEYLPIDELTSEERAAYLREQEDLRKWAYSLTPEQLAFIHGDFWRRIIYKGFIQYVATLAGFNDEDISKLFKTADRIEQEAAALSGGLLPIAPSLII